MDVGIAFGIVAKVAFGLGVLRFGLLPCVVRAVWRAPRVPETGTPADFHLPFSDAVISTMKNKRLHAWWILVAPGNPTVVMVHGWGGNAQHMLPLAQRFARAGFNSLLLDARNHGRSDNEGFSSMVKFAEDLDSGIDWLKAQPQMEAASVALLGHSVGAAAALLCASRRDDIAAVVSIASFAHPREIMARMMRARRIPYVPFGWWVLKYIEGVIGARYDDIAPVTTVAGIRVPVLLVHGTADRTIPPEDARAIHSRRRNDSTRLLLVPGGHFNIDAIRSHGDEVVDFLEGAFTDLTRSAEATSSAGGMRPS